MNQILSDETISIPREPGGALRTYIIGAVSKALADPSDALSGIDPILSRTGYSQDDIKPAFENVDDLVIAIAENRALLISQPLDEHARVGTLDDVRDILIVFGMRAWKEYSTTLVGFVKMMMAEGTRTPPLKQLVYEAGPETLTLKLRRFLALVNHRGILSISDAQLAAEQLIGMLREPLYQALMLHPISAHGRTETDRVRAGIERFIAGCAIAGGKP